MARLRAPTGSRIASAVALATVAAALAAGDAGASFPAGQGRILTVSETFFFTSLSLLNPDESPVPGFGLRFPVGIGGGGAVSPDGTLIAFSSTIAVPLGPTSPAAQDSEIYIAGVSGSGDFVTVTQNDSLESRPSWAPDGRRIAFASNRDGDWDVYVADAREGVSEALNLTADSTARDTNPRWSPDGRLIAFESDRTGSVDVFTVPSAGGSPFNLTAHPAADRLGDWSPDSARLLISSDRGGSADLFVVPAAGGVPALLVTSPGADTRPAWSPDGGSIAFSSDRDGDNDVYLVSATGENERKLTRNASEDLVQDWQPLRDTRAPTVLALQSSSVRGKPLVFRYQVDEDSRRAAVSLDFEIGNEEPDDGGILSFIGSSSGPLRTVVPGRTYSVAMLYRFVGADFPAAFRFCVRATDPSANQSEQSCARYVLKKQPPKKKRKR